MLQSIEGAAVYQKHIFHVQLSHMHWIHFCAVKCTEHETEF